MDLTEKKIDRKEIYDGAVLKVVCDRVLLPNGKEATREMCLHIGAVAVVALDGDEVLMERQFRYPHGRVFFEIPAGKLDSPDEDPEEAARRELREETGAVAGKMTYLGRIDTTPALINEKIHLYLAEELSFTERELDEDEFLTVERVDISAFYETVMRGEICDAKTQIGILKAMEIYRQRACQSEPVCPPAPPKTEDGKSG